MAPVVGAARQDSLLESQMQLGPAVPSQPHKVSNALHTGVLVLD